MSEQPLETVNLFFYAMLLLIGLLLHAMPALTRPDIFFAVTVAPEFRDSAEGRRILRRYRSHLWLGTLLAFGLLTAGILTGHFVLTLASVYWQVIAAFLAFQVARHHAFPQAAAPSTEREARLTPRRTTTPGAQLLHVGPLAMLVASALRLREHWSEIPDRFARHWDLVGHPNGWSSKTFFGVYGSLLMGATVCAMMIFLWYLMLYGTRQVRASGRSAEAEDRFRSTQLIILMSAEYLVGFTFAWVSQFPLRANPLFPPESFKLYLLFMLVYIAGIMLVLVFTGQGGSRLVGWATVPQLAPSGPPLGDRTPDQCWKLGVFYFNRSDPAILVEKRFGVGYTLNFGHPIAWVLICVILLPAFASIFIGRHMR